MMTQNARRGDHVRVLLRPGTVPNLPEAGEVEISRGVFVHDEQPALVGRDATYGLR